MEVAPAPGQALISDGLLARENLAARYGIPASILVPAIHPLLQAVDDHILFPISEAWSHRRWVRVSRLAVLKRVCFLARRVLEDKMLMVYIMPYISVKDASLLYGLIENTGDIAALNQNMEAGLGGPQLPVPGRHEVLVVHGPDRSHDAPSLAVKFFVINYGMLESKGQRT